MRHLLLASWAMCAPVAAQPDHFTTSPRGFEFTEGGMMLDLIGREPRLRYQQIDATNGVKTNRDRLGFRRDGLLDDNPAYAARTVELEVLFSESDLETAATRFESNYLENTAIVFTRKSVAFPDFTLAPAIAPANLDLILFLDNPWSYLGVEQTGNDLLWEVRVHGNSRAGQPYPMDADLAIPASSIGQSIGLGQGCVPTGGTSRATLFTTILNYGTRFNLDLLITPTLPSAPSFAFLGARDDNFVSTLLCSQLTVLPAPPNIVLGLGVSSAAGVARLALSLPYLPALVGVDLYSQGGSIDLGQPFFIRLGLTQGNRTRFPSDPPTTPQARHMWALQPTANEATSGVVDGGVIALTNHSESGKTPR